VNGMHQMIRDVGLELEAGGFEDDAGILRGGDPGAPVTDF
jgi:hypothetical protein